MGFFQGNDDKYVTYIFLKNNHFQMKYENKCEVDHL